MPACRREWGSGDDALHTVRRVLLGGDRADTAPAAQIAAQLGELDAALLRFSTRENRRVEHRLGLDARRWFESAGAALAAPLESSDAPGQRFRMRCADLAGALAALRRSDGAVLDSFAWRGSESAATLARWRPDQEMRISAREVTRRNPWGGVPGCIYLGGGDAAPGYVIAPAHSVQQRVCALAALRGSAASDAAGAPTAIAGEPSSASTADDPRWMVPPSLLTLLQPLESLRQTSGALYRLYGDDGEAPSPLGTPRGQTHGNQVRLDGTPLDVGYSIDLTIDPALQALAQKTAACYTGRHELCRALGIRRAEDGERPLGDQLLEGAMVRMAAIAVIDVASGRIEALAGAMSPCARQEVDGPGRDGACDPRLPYRVGYRADALLNPAVYHDAMPASTIKPIMATAFLADASGRGARLLASERAAMQRPGTPARDSLRGQLMRSDSARFLDRMFCADQGFAACSRPWDVQAAARAFGWDAGCSDDDERCGKTDLLFGRALDGADARGAGAPGATPIAYGRLLSEPAGQRLGAPMHLMAPSALDAGILRRCAAGPDGRRFSDDDWEKCKGGAVVDVVAEGWGQGHARASVLGVAGMMATLAAAANGAALVPRPHLVAAVRGIGSGAETHVTGHGIGASGSGGATARAADALALASAHWAGAAAAGAAAARGGRGDPERPLVQPPRRHRAHRVRAGVRCQALRGNRLARRQDRDAELSERRPHARRAGAPLPRRCGAVTRSAARRVQLAAALQVVRRRLARRRRGQRSVDEGDRGPHRAQLAARERAHPRHRRSRPEPVRRDRDADRRPAHRRDRRRIAMSVAALARARLPRRADDGGPPLPAPLVWTFDGPFERCLADLEDSLRRALLLIGDVSRVALLVDVSLPALQARVRAGDRIQPAWGRFLERLGDYGLPSFPRVRYLRRSGPLATLVVAYRS